MFRLVILLVLLTGCSHKTCVVYGKFEGQLVRSGYTFEVLGPEDDSFHAKMCRMIHSKANYELPCLVIFDENNNFLYINGLGKDGTIKDIYEILERNDESSKRNR